MTTRQRIHQRLSRGLVVTTPEHVALTFNGADLGSRAVALLLDLLFQVLMIVAVLWLANLLFFLGGDLSLALTLVLFFLVRNFYFTFFELRWQGRTPGKRLLGLRVVARDGGPLSAELVFARNLTRELEIFLPLLVLVAPADLLPEAPAWANLLTALWILALTLLPVFNRLGLRLGDLLAGTVVVYEPRTRLLEDLVETSSRRRRGELHAFTAQELDIYGIRELQVLEGLLRKSDPDAQHEELLRQVSSKILRKIGRESQPLEDPRPFLESFYTAQRGRLEQRMLLGQRREEKVR